MTGTPFGRFHHVGMAVQNTGQAMGLLRALLGAEPEGPRYEDSNQGVFVQFLRAADLRIELLEPAGSPGPLDSILRRGIALYHICYEVDDLDERLLGLVNGGANLLSAPKPAVAFGGRRVAFVMVQGLMIELVEGE
ncbi:MAG TPA: VOC family protein [Phycisphaerae bacterium]|nr:VOC family protein [Phycisphaerae bacterium]